MKIRCRLFIAIERVIYCILHIYSREKKTKRRRKVRSIHGFVSFIFFWVDFAISKFPLNEHRRHAYRAFRRRIFPTPRLGAWHCLAAWYILFVPQIAIADGIVRCLSTCVHSVSGDADGFYRRVHCHRASTTNRCGALLVCYSLDFFNFILRSFSVVPDNRFHSNSHLGTGLPFPISLCLMRKNCYFYALLNIACKRCSICIYLAYHPYYALLFPFGNALLMLECARPRAML